MKGIAFLHIYSKIDVLQVIYNNNVEDRYNHLLSVVCQKCPFTWFIRNSISWAMLYNKRALFVRMFVYSLIKYVWVVG